MMLKLLKGFSVIISSIILRGNSSGVEHNLAKVRAVGSNPISRSIFFLLLPTLLFSFAVEKTYFVDKDQVFSTDVFPVDKKFLLFAFGNRNSKQLTFNNLKQDLQKHTIEANSKHYVIFFYKISPVIIENIQHAVSKKYEKRAVLVDFVAIKPQSMVDVAGLDFLQVTISDSSLKRAKGFGKAHFGLNGETLEVLNFSYEISGRQRVLVASQKVNRGDTITTNNTTYEEVAIKHRILESIDEKKLGSFEARVGISSGTIIDDRRVKKSFLVKRGEQVTAVFQENGIYATFPLIAQKSGYLGESIPLKNSSNREFRGVIIGENRVQIK